MQRYLDDQHANSLIQGNFAFIFGAPEHRIVIVLIREGDVDVGGGAVGGGRVLSGLDL